jgi:glycosyltransferase involved in cell wall biosynthesis
MVNESISNSQNPDNKGSRIKVVHIYKDFDIYNGLIDIFLLMARMISNELFDFKVCVFNYKGSIFGRQFRELGGKLDSLGAKWEDNPCIIYKLYKYLKKERPHIVQTHILKPNLYGRLAAKLAGVPVIISTELTLRNQAPTFLKRIRDLFFHPLNAYLNRYTNLIICVSEAIKRQWENKDINDKIRVVYPPFDISKISHLSLKRTFEKNGEWVIGTVGRLSEEKRHIDLLKAFVKVSKVFPNTRLLIVGDGYLRKVLEETAEKFNLCNKVTFVGFPENVFMFLKEMDLFVLPSRTEGAPVSILEAMVMGLPVIATTAGGIPEIVINNQTGLLVNIGNFDELASAVIKLLSNPEEMKKMGENGRHRVLTHFHPKQFIDQYESIYKALVSAKGLRHIV